MRVMQQEPMLRVGQVARWLGLHVNTIKRMSDRGELQFYRLGSRGDRRYRPEDIEAYLATRRDTRGESGRASGDARGADQGVSNG